MKGKQKEKEYWEGIPEMIERYNQAWSMLKERRDLTKDLRESVERLADFEYLKPEERRKMIEADAEWRHHQRLNHIAFHQIFCKILDDFGIHEEYFKALDFDDDMMECGVDTDTARELLFKKMYGELYWEEKLKEES